MLGHLALEVVRKRMRTVEQRKQHERSSGARRSHARAGSSLPESVAPMARCQRRRGVIGATRESVQVAQTGGPC